jgi:hypothetical protein
MTTIPNKSCRVEGGSTPAQRSAGLDKALDCLEFMPLSLTPLEVPSFDPGEHQVIDAETAYVFKIVGSRERAERIVASLNAAAKVASTPASSEPVAWQFQALSGMWSNCGTPDPEDLKKEPHRFRALVVAHQPAAGAEREALRKLVDVVWNEATESTAVPSTKWADKLIDKVFPATSLSPVRSVKKTKTTFMERLRSDAEARAALKGGSHE